MALVLLISAPNWGIDIDLSGSPGGIQNRTQAHHATEYDYPKQLDLLPEICTDCPHVDFLLETYGPYGAYMDFSTENMTRTI